MQGHDIARCMMDVHSMPCGQAAPSLQRNSYFHHLKWTTAENDTVHHWKEIIITESDHREALSKLCWVVSLSLRFLHREIGRSFALNAAAKAPLKVASMKPMKPMKQGALQTWFKDVQSLLYEKLYHGVMLLQFVRCKMICNPKQSM